MFQDPRQRAVAIGVWISAFSAGSAIGPVLGGILLEHFWWGSVFLLALPVMGLLLVLGPIVLPEYTDPDAGRLDLASAVMSLVAVLAVIFGLKQIAQDGFGAAADRVDRRSASASAFVWVRRQLSLADPMIDLRLFRIPSFSASLAVNFLAIFVAVGYFLFVAQYLQLVRRAVAARGRPVVACPRRSASSSGRTWLPGSCGACGRPTSWAAGWRSRRSVSPS